MFSLLPAVLAILSVASADRYVSDDSKGKLDMGMVASLHDVPLRATSFTTEINLGEEITGKLVVQAAGLKTGIGMRDNRMYDYCLSAAQYPVVEFEVRGATGDTEGLLSHAGSGQVTLHGKLKVRSTTRDIQVPLTYTWTGEQLGFKGNIEIKWTDYGVPDPSIFISTLYPDIKVNFDLQMSKGF